jgi:hypothetical protein
MPTRLVAPDEGLSPDSFTSCPAILQEDLLPSSLRPPASHKPDFIRLLEPRFVGHTNGRRRYSSIQIGEWKFGTYHSLSHTAKLIRNINTPFANAIRQYWPGTEVNILPIVMSCIGTPHNSTITSLTSLLTLFTHPPDKLVSKTRLDSTRILTQLHLHIVQWLHHLLLIYRIKSRTTTRCTSSYRTLTHPWLTATTLTHVTLPPGGRGKNPDHLLERLDLSGSRSSPDL